jgi:hypothetical protein
LRTALKAVTDRAAAIDARAKDSAKNFHTVLDQAESMVHEIDDAAADVQSAIGQHTNLGPDGPLSE